MARRRPLVRAAGKNQQIPAGDALVLAGALDEAPIVSLASAASVAIGAALGNTIQITGSTTINAFDAIAAGVVRRLTFAASLLLTHNATSLIMPDATSVVTAPGDSAVFLSLGSGNWRCISYQFTKRSYVLAQKTSSQSFSSNTFTKVLFDKATDLLGEYSASTGVFTAIYAGYYLVSGFVHAGYQPSSGGDFSVSLFVNGNEKHRLCEQLPGTGPSSGSSLAQGGSTTVVYLAAGDQLDCRVYVYNPNASSLSVTAYAQLTYLIVRRLN